MMAVIKIAMNTLFPVKMYFLFIIFIIAACKVLFLNQKLKSKKRTLLCNLITSDQARIQGGGHLGHVPNAQRKNLRRLKI